MNGINIKKLEKEYETCDYCESNKNVLEIESDVSCYEYGSCGTYLSICEKCISKIISGEIAIIKGKITKL